MAYPKHSLTHIEGYEIKERGPAKDGCYALLLFNAEQNAWIVEVGKEAVPEKSLPGAVSYWCRHDKRIEALADFGRRLWAEGD